MTARLLARLARAAAVVGAGLAGAVVGVLWLALTLGRSAR